MAILKIYFETIDSLYAGTWSIKQITFLQNSFFPFQMTLLSKVFQNRSFESFVIELKFSFASKFELFLQKFFIQYIFSNDSFCSY